jgi:hypothetical protein
LFFVFKPTKGAFFFKNNQCVTFGLPDNQLLEAFAWMESRTNILEVIPPDKIADFYNWNAKSFYFYNNNGNILEFIARFNLDNELERSFNGRSIVSIIEMGFVAKNASRLCEELIDRYGFPFFQCNPN